MSELRECPLCGGAVNWCAIPEDPNHECHMIQCATCGLFDLIGLDNPDTIEEMRAICATRWNRRTPTAREPAEPMTRHWHEGLVRIALADEGATKEDLEQIAMRALNWWSEVRPKADK